MMRELTSLVAVLSLCACYTYLPLKTPDPRPGTRVLAEITDSGSARLGEYLGREAGAVEGLVVTVSDTAIALAVTSVRARDGQQAFWKGEAVSLRRAFIGRLRERRLAKGGTLLVTGALAAGALLAVDAFSGGIFGTEKGGPPPPGQ
jgi:hypothetical protein